MTLVPTWNRGKEESFQWLFYCQSLTKLLTWLPCTQWYHLSQLDVEGIYSNVRWVWHMTSKISSASDSVTLWWWYFCRRPRRHIGPILQRCTSYTSTQVCTCCSLIRHFSLFEYSSSKTNTINSIHAYLPCLLSFQMPLCPPPSYISYISPFMLP